MNKLKLLLSLILLSSIAVCQPSIEWNKSFGGFQRDYFINTIDSTIDHGFVVSGYMKSIASNGIVMKFDSAGSKIWEKSYGTSELFDIQQLPDSNFFAAGSSLYSNLTSSSAMTLLKIGWQGDTVWKRQYFWEYFDPYYLNRQQTKAHSVQNTTDGGYVLAGTVQQDNSGFFNRNPFVVKVNVNGDVIWKSMINTLWKRYSNEERFSIKQAPGGYILAGGADHLDSSKPSAKYFSDCVIAKLDESGNLLWNKRFGGFTSNGNFNDVINTTDGGFIVVGYNNARDGSLSGTHGGDDLWVVKLDSTGVVTWQRALGGSGNDTAFSVIQTIPDGGYIIVGATTSNDGDVTGHMGTDNTSDAWVIKLDSNGNMLWQSCLGGLGNDAARDITKVEQGYVFTGTNFSRGFGVSDYWLVKTDSSGNPLWQVIEGASGKNLHASSVQQTENGYIIGGSGNVSTYHVSFNHGGSDGWIVKIDNSGNLAWEKTYGGTGQDYINAIEKSIDSVYVLAGTSSSNDGDVTLNHGETDFWLVKIDTAGNIIWQKSFGGSGNDSATSIQALPDGGYIVAGSTNSNDGDVTASFGLKDFWVIRLDSAGNLVWQKSFGGNKEDIATAIEYSLDGGFLVAGKTSSTDGFFTGKRGGNGLLPDSWIVKLDAVGNIEWQKVFGGANTDYATGIEKTLDSGFVVAGTYYEYVSHSRADYWVVKLSNDGVIIWEKVFGSAKGTGFDQIANAISRTPDGGFVLTGTSNGPYEYGNRGEVIGFNGYMAFNSADFWVVRINSEGNLLWQKMLGGRFYDSSYAVQPTRDGGFIVAGDSRSGNTGNISEAIPNTAIFESVNWWVVKLAPEVLPVTLLNFEGFKQNEIAVLNWRTANETGNKGFEVERSSDGRIFNAIGSIRGQQTSTTLHVYSFTDNNPLNGANYYRLKQIDVNGDVAYSNIVKLTFSRFVWEIVGNPAMSYTTVKIQLDLKANTSIEVISTTGVKLRALNKGILSSGNYSFSVDLSGLPAGMYVIKLKIGENIYTKNIVRY